MSSSSDELVTQFLAVTGCSDTSTANNYIEMSGGNLETAVGLYMEHQGGGGGGGAAASAGGMAGGGDGGFEDDIRAPDATRTMRLMDEGPSMMGGGGGMMMGGGAAGMIYGSQMDPSMRMMQEMMEEQLARSAFGASTSSARDAVDAGVAAAAATNRGESKESDDNDNTMDAGDDDDGDYNYDDEDDDYEMETDDAEVQPPAAPTLSDMFAAPSHLMHKAGGFQGARQMSKDSKRWLLVNIQKDAEFSSHALNRDVWRNDLVENLIQEGFIFWQEPDISIEGRQYVQRYKVDQFPHVAIIDPRTGRLLWRKEGWTQQNALTAESFAEMAMDFCSRNSFDKPPQAPGPQKGPSSGGAPPLSAIAAASTSTPMVGNSSRPMTEEEQIQAAVDASLNSISQPPPSAAAAASIDADQKPAASMNGADQQPQAEEEQESGNAFLDGLLALDVGAEPASGGARLQLRMPDGKRSVRQFNPSDAVEVIFAFVAQTLKEGGHGDREFKLMAGFPPKDLLPDLKTTIGEKSLNGQAITIRWA
mmetsp:Transcript_1259/g.3546  ORF Transcript_1259/g.3546 Transcript_1259/m.3546 type:complete len:533 (-) Transcript_1259:1980-3578(-)|eukprot:CAMPEP_0168749216 /NCGR_PEP_ID=MMETSP0724-20121128/16591_1 /TAXON_ID=265536 /ORGANISM="Amphiprora sp., Strain CCMP467" /LENGTH=532 /DNA_ID=CAMNT_0008797097 /DNA_START=133 /DNA_END=1731 /DNA_ORIENTATION=-